MDEKKLHKEFMSIIGESHPGLTFEEYRDSCVFLLFYDYCCLRFDQEIEDNYKLKEMVRLAVRGKLQMASFLQFMENASRIIHMVSGQFELASFSFFKRLKGNVTPEKQKSFARFFRKLIKKIDAWDSEDMLYLHFADYFEELITEFSRMKKETFLSDGLFSLFKLFFDHSGSPMDRVILPYFKYGRLLGALTDNDYLTEMYGYEDQADYIEILNILCYMKNLPFANTHFLSEEEWYEQNGLGASADRIAIFMPDGAGNGELMCRYEDLPYKKDFLSSRTKGELPFLMSALPFLKENGSLVAVFPSAMLYREGKEAQMRKFLMEDLNCLDSVMLLPDQLFQSSGQKEVLLYLKFNRDRKDIMFFDATDLGKLEEEDFTKIEDALKNRESEAGFCACASPEDIRKNDYNLNLPRYIAKSVKEIILDVHAQRLRIEEIDKELIEIDKKILMYKRDLEL